MNKETTERMVAWLTSEHNTEENVRLGATLLLQVNRNQGMYQRIMRNPLRHVETVVYQLQKLVDMRLEGYSIRDVVQLNSEVMPPIKEAIADEGEGKTSKGKRPDHDTLPGDIKDIWEQNAERWKKIKEVYNTCKSLNKPCDRFEHLKVLKEAWYTYKREMARYDDFKSTAADGNTESSGGSDTPVLSAEDTKAVSAARSYLSKNLKNWTSPTEDQVAKIRERVDLLVRLNQTIGDDLKNQLLAIGIKVGEDA